MIESIHKEVESMNISATLSGPSRGEGQELESASLLLA